MLTINCHLKTIKLTSLTDYPQICFGPLGSETFVYISQVFYTVVGTGTGLWGDWGRREEPW